MIISWGDWTHVFRWWHLCSRTITAGTGGNKVSTGSLTGGTTVDVDSARTGSATGGVAAMAIDAGTGADSIGTGAGAVAVRT